MPAGLTIDNVTDGATFDCSIAGQTVTCTSNAVIPNGASGVTVATISVTPTQVGAIGNTAVVSGGGDNTPGNNTSPPVNTNVNAAPVPDLAMSKSGPGTATVGIAFNYVLTLANVGTGPTTGTVTVSDVVPAGLTINSATNGPVFSCGIAGQTVTCSTGTTIPNGASGIVVATINVTPTAQGPVSNTATVSGGGDNTPGNNTSPPVNTSVNAAPGPDLMMGKSGPGTATVGIAFDYTLTLANVGSGPTARNGHRHRFDTVGRDDRQCRGWRQFLVRQQRPDRDVHDEHRDRRRDIRAPGRHHHRDAHRRRPDQQHGNRQRRRRQLTGQQHEPAGQHVGLRGTGS